MIQVVEPNQIQIQMDIDKAGCDSPGCNNQTKLQCIWSTNRGRNHRVVDCKKWYCELHIKGHIISYSTGSKKNRKHHTYPVNVCDPCWEINKKRQTRNSIIACSIMIFIMIVLVSITLIVEAVSEATNESLDN